MTHDKQSSLLRLSPDNGSMEFGAPVALFCRELKHGPLAATRLDDDFHLRLDLRAVSVVMLLGVRVGARMVVLIALFV
jgi:hypothetical protein